MLLSLPHTSPTSSSIGIQKGVIAPGITDNPLTHTGTLKPWYTWYNATNKSTFFGTLKDLFPCMSPIDQIQRQVGLLVFQFYPVENAVGIIPDSPPLNHSKSSRWLYQGDDRGTWSNKKSLSSPPAHFSCGWKGVKEKSSTASLDSDAIFLNVERFCSSVIHFFFNTVTNFSYKFYCMQCENSNVSILTGKT